MVDFAKKAAEARLLREIRERPSPERFRRFVRLREEARLMKELVGGPGPHSEDPVIAVNRFCNVDREDDAVTRYIAHFRAVYQYDERGADFLVPQVLAMRVWNHPPTLDAIMPVDDPAATSKALRELRDRGEKTMRGAYMMPVHGSAGQGRSADDYYLAAVEQARQMRWRPLRSLRQVAEQLMGLQGIGEFLANQVCADLRYTTLYCDAPDVSTFVLCGPGTRRGLDRYVDLADPKKLGTGAQAAYVERLLKIRDELADEGHRLAKTFRDPNNLSNCFCEWDKHERVLQGEVKSLHRYP